MVVFAAVLLGCGETPQPPTSSARANDAAPTLITLAPHLTELVYSAGAGRQLIAVVEYSDHPPAASELPRIGDAFRVDLERITEFSPDIILAWDGGNPDAMIMQLQRRGFRVEVITTDTLDDVPLAIKQIGALAGTQQQATSAASSYRERLQRLRARYSSAERQRVLYQISAQPLYTIGARHPITEMIETCGGQNIFADVKQVAPAVTVEEVIVRAPQVIIAGDPPGDELLQLWQRWPQLPAVADSRLYTVDASLVARSSARILDGLQAICTHLNDS